VSGIALGAIVAAAGLGLQLCAGGRNLRTAGFAAYVAGVLILAGDLLHSPISTMRTDAGRRPALAAAGLLLGLIAIGVAAVIAHRKPTLALMAVVAAAPGRIPLHAGGQQANLLVPLYGVLLAIALAHAYTLALGREQRPQIGLVGWTMAALIGWSAISLLWSTDSHQGGVQMLFFYLPFGYLATRIVALRPTLRQLRLMLYTDVALALVFAAVAFWQYESRHLFWNQKIIVSNQYASFFRVNSLFYDASVYGRFMAVAIVLLAAVAVYRRATPQLLGLMALLFLAQYLSYSQSSLMALAAGSLLIGATIWSRRLLVGLAVTVALVGVAGLLVSSHGSSTKQVTSGRSVLLSDGWRVIRHHPIDGAGLGGFARAALAGSAHPNRTRTAASHTTPVTVLAELGPLGLAAYLALIGSIAWAAFRTGPDRLLRFGLAAALAAVLTSSLFYNAYFEDPASWILTALIVSVAALPNIRIRQARA